MPRYVAFLRGVSPLNASMPALAACVEAAGFAHVRTLLSSGNVAFDARSLSCAALAGRLEAAMTAALGRSFDTFVRPSAALAALVAGDPYGAFRPSADEKRVVIFLRAAPDHPPALPLTTAGGRILALAGTEAFCVYQPDSGSPRLMALIEKTFGKKVTTRTWDTVRKCALA